MTIGPSADATSGYDGLEVVTDDIMARSDAELLAASRTGDQLAYGELFRRHAPAATALARRLTGHPSDADDLVSEAFTKVLSALKNGSGPTSAMRPYLLTAVRRVHVDKAVASQRVQPTDDIGAHDPGVPFVDPALADLERSMVAQAYQQLPERWQMVLWHTEVEELSPRDIAPLLGMSPNAVAALALRARAGLREAYLAAHISSTATAECQRLLPKLAAYVRGSAAARERAAVERHLPDCEDCRAVLVELQDVGGRMRAVVAPLVLGLGASGYLADIALLPKLALPMAKVGALGHGATAVPGPPTPSGAGSASGGSGGASGAAGWAVAALAALIVAGAVISAIALSHNDGPGNQAGRPPGASQSASQSGSSNSTPAPPGATQPPPLPGPIAGGATSPKPLSERTGSGRTPTALANTPAASTPVPTSPPTAKSSVPSYVPPEPSTTTPPPTSPSSTPTTPTDTTSTTTSTTTTVTTPPPPPDAPTPSSVTAGDFVSGGNGLISVSLSAVAPVATTVTVTLPAPLSSTAAGCAPDATGATVCTLTIPAGAEFVSLPVQVGTVDATTTVDIPMVVSGEGLTSKSSTSQVVVEPAGTYGAGLPGRYTTLDNVSSRIVGGSWLIADENGLSTPSTAELSLPGEVTYARLYWVGYQGGPSRESMDLTAPDGTTLTVTSAPGDTIDVPPAGQQVSGWPGSWQSSADVTAFVAAHGAGAYTGSQPPFVTPGQHNGNTFAGWVLVVVAKDPSVPRQLFTLSDGYALLTPQQSLDTYTNAQTAGANRVNIVGFGGDGPNRDSMYYTLDGAPVLFRENDFNGDGIDGASPENVGMDLASIDMTANPYPISVVADADRIYLGIMTISKDR